MKRTIKILNDLPDKWSSGLPVLIQFKDLIGSKSISHEQNESFRRRLDGSLLWGHSMNQWRCKIDIKYRVEEHQMYEKSNDYQLPIHF